MLEVVHTTRLVDRDGVLRRARERRRHSREYVARRLQPPISAKTLERWEAGSAGVKLWALEQLAELYEAPELLETKPVA